MPAPYWSIYARVYRDHAKAAERASTHELRENSRAVCDALKRATLVYIPSDQVDAIPRLGETFLEEAVGVSYLRAPFDLTFLAIGGIFDDLETGWADTPLYAALLRQMDDRLLAIPFFLASMALRRPGDPPFRVAAAGEAYADEEVGFATLRWLSSPTFQAHSELGEQIAGGAARALRALFLLESVNVRLREGKPAGPGHRGSGVPSFEVVIREPTRSEHESSAQTVDWSHRWEVRGHFKHFRRGPVYDRNSDDRIETEGDSYVRVWCPPFVKGPVDKPLIPKAHVYAGGG